MEAMHAEVEEYDPPANEKGRQDVQVGIASPLVCLGLSFTHLQDFILEYICDSNCLIFRNTDEFSKFFFETGYW